MQSLELIAVAIYSLALGSFINAWLWRQPSQDQKDEEEDTGREVSKSVTQVKPSIVHGRSICPDCGHQLTIKDLVPVVSWLVLKGKCRYCNNKISWQYPVVEITVMVLGILSYIFWPSSLNNLIGYMQLFTWIGMVAIFVSLSIYDYRWYLLPDSMVMSLLVLVVIYQVLAALLGAGIYQWLISPIIGGIGAFTFFYLLYLIGRGKWMGGGDVKLSLALGLLLGGVGTLVWLFLAFNIAAITSLILIATGVKTRKSMVPFGPFLLLGAWLSFNFGDQLINWYLGIF